MKEQLEALNPQLVGLVASLLQALHRIQLPPSSVAVDPLLDSRFEAERKIEDEKNSSWSRRLEAAEERCTRMESGEDEGGNESGMDGVKGSETSGEDWVVTAVKKFESILAMTGKKVDSAEKTSKEKVSIFVRLRSGSYFPLRSESYPTNEALSSSSFSAQLPQHQQSRRLHLPLGPNQLPRRNPPPVSIPFQPNRLESPLSFPPSISSSHFLQNHPFKSLDHRADHPVKPNPILQRRTSLLTRRDSTPRETLRSIIGTSSEKMVKFEEVAGRVEAFLGS